MINQQTVQPLPSIFIGKDLISQRVNRYLSDKHPILSQMLSTDGPPREDTKSIWYAKEHVQTWLDEIQYLNADGMRVYFGAYGDNEEGRPPGQLCLLVVLTRADADGLQQDIILENEPDFGLRCEGAQSRSFPGSGPFGQSAKPKEYNYGAPCPPVCTPPKPVSSN